MKKLVVVADDFGWTNGINRGILRTYKEGIVTEISLMLLSPGTKDAASIIKSEGINNVGLHMTLSPAIKSNSTFSREEYKKLLSKSSQSEIEKIVNQEIEEFTQVTGFKPTHIAPQYGIHGELKLLNVLIDYSKAHGTPLRIPKTALMGGAEANENYAAEITLKRNGVKTTDYLFNHVVGNDIVEIKSKFLNELTSLGDTESAEILLHPGYFDEEILGYSSLGYERTRDLAIAIDPDFKKSIEDLGISFVNYSEL